MLSLSHVSCGYGGVPVVKDVTFQTGPGEKICIIGPNGCGKTTLLRAVMALLPYSGHILWEGQSTQKWRRRDFARRMALMSQTASLYFPYTVYETVMLGRYARQKGSFFRGEAACDRQEVMPLLEMMGLLDCRQKRVTELSGGQLQRVFLARAFAQQPQLLLLDEPTNHLDVTYQAETMAYIRQWAQAGQRTVIGVLHDLNLALSFADRVLVLHEGRLAADLCPAALIDSPILNDIYRMDVKAFMRRSLQLWQR